MPILTPSRLTPDLLTEFIAIGNRMHRCRRLRADETLVVPGTGTVIGTQRPYVFFDGSNLVTIYDTQAEGLVEGTLVQYRKKAHLIVGYVEEHQLVPDQFEVECKIPYPYPTYIIRNEGGVRRVKSKEITLL